jgi:hypothetical protein
VEKVTAVQIIGDEVIVIFGGRGNLSEAEIARLANSRAGGNYVHYRGGMIRFGKLTMTNADLKIIDTNPKDPFDFSIDHYNVRWSPVTRRLRRVMDWWLTRQIITKSKISRLQQTSRE